MTFIFTILLKKILFKISLDKSFMDLIWRKKCLHDFIEQTENKLMWVKCQCGARKVELCLQLIKLKFVMFWPAKLIMRNVSIFVLIFVLEDVLNNISMFLGSRVNLLSRLFSLLNYKIWDLQDKATLLSNSNVTSITTWFTFMLAFLKHSCIEISMIIQ